MHKLLYNYIVHQQAFDNALAGLFKQNGPSVKYITNSYEKVLTETKIHLKFVTPFPTPKHYICMSYVYIIHIYGETIFISTYCTITAYILREFHFGKFQDRL